MKPPLTHELLGILDCTTWIEAFNLIQEIPTRRQVLSSSEFIDIASSILRSDATVDIGCLCLVLFFSPTLDMLHADISFAENRLGAESASFTDALVWSLLSKLLSRASNPATTGGISYGNKKLCRYAQQLFDMLACSNWRDVFRTVSSSITAVRQLSKSDRVLALLKRMLKRCEQDTIHNVCCLLHQVRIPGLATELAEAREKFKHSEVTVAFVDLALSRENSS